MTNTLTDLPNNTDGADVWLNWYKTMRNRIGQKYANELFIDLWSKMKPDNANTSELRLTLKKYGITIDSTTLLGSVEDTATNLLSDVGTIYKDVGIAIAFAIGAGLFIIGMGIYKGTISANVKT